VRLLASIMLLWSHWTLGGGWACTRHVMLTVLPTHAYASLAWWIENRGLSAQNNRIIQGRSTSTPASKWPWTYHCMGPCEIPRAFHWLFASLQRRGTVSHTFFRQTDASLMFLVTGCITQFTWLLFATTSLLLPHPPAAVIYVINTHTRRYWTLV